MTTPTMSSTLPTSPTSPSTDARRDSSIREQQPLFNVNEVPSRKHPLIQIPGFSDEDTVSHSSTLATRSSVSLLESNISNPNALVWKVTLLASISGFMFGYDTGYVSSILVTIGTDLSPNGEQLSVAHKQLITSATSMGALIGSSFLLAGTMADSRYIGRKKTLLISDLLFVLGAFIQFVSHSVSSMVTGRVIMGFGVGIGSLIAPLFISELAPSKYRGRLVVVNCLCITGGQLIAYMIGAICKWRLVVFISIFPCILQFLGLLSSTDSPRFLIMTGKKEEAFEALKLIYTDAKDNLVRDAVNELSVDYSSEELKSSSMSKFKAGLKDLFQIPSNRRALIIGCGLQAAQQFVGFNSLMYFSSTVFKMVGYDNSTGISCIIAGTNFLFTAISLFAIDKVGRRRILLISLPLLCLAQVICAIAFFNLDIKVESNVSAQNLNGWGIVVLFGLVSFVALYAIGLGNVPWQQSELFPQNVRGLGTSFATSTNWFGSMTIAACFLTLMKELSPCGTFLLFGLITSIFWILIYFLYPEFGGLQLEEVQLLLKDRFDIKLSLQIHQERLQLQQNGGYARI